MTDTLYAAMVTFPDTAMAALPVAMLGLLAIGVALFVKSHFDEQARAARLRAVVAEANFAREKIAQRMVDVMPVAERPAMPRLAEHLSACENKARKITAALDDLIRAERIQSTTTLLSVRDDARKLSLHLHGILRHTAPGMGRERIGERTVP